MGKSNSFLFSILLAMLAGCNLLENDLAVDRPRGRNPRPDNAADSVNNIKSPDEPAELRLTLDTTVFVSAVRCGSGYDWQRDTAYGCADAQLILYKNGEEVLCLPAGGDSHISAAPDMHHILDGHLYTEYCDYSRTFICRDGEELFTISGRELLVGLLEREGEVYTLSLRLSSGGLVYRKNGVAVFSKSGAKAFGSFDDPSYGPGGALYMDAGALCFAYKEGLSCYIVRDGLPTLVTGTGWYDVKSVLGKDVAVGSNALGHRWKEPRIWRNGTSWLISGESADDGEQGKFRIMDEFSRAETVFQVRNGIAYCSGNVRKVLDRDAMEAQSFCFSSRCAAIMGGGLLVLESPRDGGTPNMTFEGKKTVFEGLEGYLTGVSADISLPKSLVLPDRGL